MTHAEQLAEFVAQASYSGLSEAARAQLKIRVLDALGCAIGALEGEPIRMLREQLHDFGGASAASELEEEGTRDVEWSIGQARRFLDAGAYMIMIESEGITESVKTWRTDVPAKIANALGLEKIMFEAAEPEVFAWYVKNFGPEVNLFVDHSQIVHLEVLRAGIWGTKSLWGRVQTYKG